MLQAAFWISLAFVLLIVMFKIYSEVSCHAYQGDFPRINNRFLLGLALLGLIVVTVLIALNFIL